jgi:hypothetical protein
MGVIPTLILRKVEIRFWVLGFGYPGSGSSAINLAMTRDSGRVISNFFYITNKLLKSS